MVQNRGYTPPDPHSKRSQKRRLAEGRRSRNHQGEGGNIRTIVGVTGLKHIGGRIREEYLNAIKNWSTEVKLYLEMRDDPIIGALTDAIKLPLQAASFDVEAAPGGSPNDEAAAEWLWETMNNMEGQTWISHVEDALECLDFGFALGEIILDKRDDGRLWLKNIDPRGQESLNRWEYDKDERDKLVAFIQNDPNSGNTFEIPLAKCLHFRYRGRKGNPQGHSILRALYRPYKFARNLEDLEGIGIERDVGGMPYAKLTDENFEPADLVDLKAALKGLRRDEEVYLIAPPGVDIPAYGGGSKIYDVNVVIDRWHKITLMRFFAQFLILGMGTVGTQSLVKGSQDFFTLVLEAVQGYLVETWNLQLVPYIFRFNQWTGISAHPTIKWEKPGKVDLNALVTALNTAKGAGIFTPTDVDEDHLRAIADLPELPEEERGAPRDVEQPPMPGLFDTPEAGLKETSKRINRLERHLSELISNLQDRTLKKMSPEDWGKAYEGDLPHWATDKTPSAFAQDFVKRLKAANSKSVLEIGCGNGRDSIFFAEANFKVTGVDVVPKAVEIAKTNAKEIGVHVDFRTANAEALPFANESFDAVYTLSVLHSTNIKRSFKELSRVLKKGGLAFVYIYSNTQKVSGEVDTTATLEEFIALMKASGLTIQDLYTDQEEDFDEFGECHRVFVAYGKKE